MRQLRAIQHAKWSWCRKILDKTIFESASTRIEIGAGASVNEIQEHSVRKHVEGINLVIIHVAPA